MSSVDLSTEYLHGAMNHNFRGITIQHKDATWQTTPYKAAVRAWMLSDIFAIKHQNEQGLAYDS